MFCVTTYFETKSFKNVQTKYRRQFNFNHYPDKKQIFRWVAKFKATGTVHNLNERVSPSIGAKVTARTPENVDAVRDSVGRSPKKSTRRRSQEHGISHSTLRRILFNDLQLYPYRMHIKHKLTAADMSKRVVMCQWLDEKINGEPNFLDNVWFSDEAHFLLSGHVNRKNNVFWGTQSPNEILQRPLHSVRCTVWIAISKHGIIGPFWFEDEHNNAVMVTKERYIVVLKKFLTRLRSRRHININHQWFQQDGATPHTANLTIEWLDDKFPGRLISRRREPEWAPYSPDLNPPDFFLWGFLKDNVYKNRPQSISELKQVITTMIKSIKKDVCVRVVNNFALRIQECLKRDGGHLEHVLK